MNEFEEPAKQINIQADEKKHETTGNYKKFHNPCVRLLCIFFFGPVKKEWLSCHSKSLYQNSDQYRQPVYISKYTQLVFCFLNRQINYMLVNEPAQHIV